MFYKRDAASRVAISDEVNLFETPYTKGGVNNAKWVEILPKSAQDAVPIIYNIEENQHWLDWGGNQFIKFEVQAIMQEIGAADRFLEITDHVSLIQMPGATIIREILAAFNGKQVHREHLYAFKTYIDYVLTYPPTAKNSHLALCGYYPEGEKGQNSKDADGFTNRRNLITDGKIVEFICPINIPQFNINKLLMNLMEIGLEIHPNSNEFMFIAPTLKPEQKLKLRIVRSTLMVKRLELTDALSKAITLKLKEPGQAAKYKVRNSEAKTLAVATGVKQVDHTVFTGIVPRKIILATFKRTDFDGDVKTSPFLAQHHFKKSIKFLVNGEEIPHVSYDLDYATGKCLRAYYDMMDACGFAFTPYSNGITLDMFKNGWNFYVFNLTRSLDDHSEFDVVVRGAVTLRMEFSKPLEEDIQILIIGEHDQLMKINDDRIVTTDLMS